jgi:hypothetical protein
MTNFDPSKDQMAYSRDLAGNIPKISFQHSPKAYRIAACESPAPI